MRLGRSEKVKVLWCIVESGDDCGERHLSLVLGVSQEVNPFIKVELLGRTTRELRLTCGPDADSQVTLKSMDLSPTTQLSLVPFSIILIGSSSVCHMSDEKAKYK
jgi:hypothetical protein